MSADMKFESGVAALVDEARRMCPKLTPRLWRSDGRVVAIAGGLLGHRELLKELRDAVERTIETLLRPDLGRLDDEGCEIRLLFCLRASTRSA